MKKKWMLLLVLAALFTRAACAQEQFVDEFPVELRFTQQTQTDQLTKKLKATRVYPDTCSDAVDAQMRALIDEMAARGEAALSGEQMATETRLDVGSTITRSGESLLSFLTLAQVTGSRELISVEHEARVYDMKTGERVALADLFKEDSGIYDLLAGEIRRQLSAAFDGYDPDEAALDALCTKESVQQADFTLGAAQMTLTYRADAIYPGRASLLHVRIGYPELREMMTEYGLRQTDNSRYRMVALTYDDGGARGISRSVLETLRDYGARATFFLVGKRIATNRDIVILEQNGNHSIQSHTYTHSYPDQLKDGDAFIEQEKMDAELNALIGVVPTMMRAPGGRYQHYLRQGMDYPLMQWSLASGDSGNPHVNKIAERVIGNAQDGDVILMHDINEGSPQYTRRILENFEARGILCVTVEELFIDAGVPLESGHVYQNPYRIVE